MRVPASNKNPFSDFKKSNYTAKNNNPDPNFVFAPNQSMSCAVPFKTPKGKKICSKQPSITNKITLNDEPREFLKQMMTERRPYKINHNSSRSR